MARGATITVENSFTQGLITEFTAMNFPENAVTDTDNCIYSEFGRVTPRPGINFENDYEVHAMSGLSSNPDTFVEFKWPSVGNLGTVTFLVQQVGDTLHFFAESDPSLSANKKSFTVDLTDFATAGQTAGTIAASPCQFTTGRGYLFVVHPNCEPFYVSYNSEDDTISTEEIEIKIRDMGGVDDGLEPDDRPDSLTDLHKYNLFNQGWYATARVQGTGVPQQVLSNWASRRDDYPSNSDVWWIYKNANDAADFAPNDGYVERFAVGNTPAPKGHYIYDAFDIDRTAMTDIPGLPSETAGSARPSAVCFYAGRVWYAGTRANKYSSRLYFSQLIEGDVQFGDCYQINDPTSETVFDIIDTDGGTIDLPLIERVVALQVIKDSLIIIGTNAVYAISGTDNGSFKATDYTVKYISSVGGVSHLSVVEAEGALFWWNYDGIYALSTDQMGLNFTVGSISKQTIKTFLEDIPTENRQYIKGVYNKREQIIRWIFSDDDEITGYVYNRILDFNAISRAFYPHSITMSLAPRVSGLINIGGQRSVSSTEVVTDNALADVTNNAAEDVEVTVIEFSPVAETFKFLITGSISSGSSGLTYGEMNDIRNKDWVSFDETGTSYSSYGISGYRVRGDFLRSFNATPIVFIVKQMDEGSLLVSGIWDYGFRETSTHQLYLTRPEVDHIIRRVKLRGKGRSLQIKFESVGSAPFELIGWSSFDTGGTQP